MPPAGSAKREDAMPNITPFLWFNAEAEDAANFYVSIFPNSKINRIARRTDAVPGPTDVLTVDFELDGKRYLALNGGPRYEFNEAVSLMVHCNTQDEIDRYWSALTADGGEEGVCGWLKDRYGLFWQIVPEVVTELLAGADRAKASRVMAAVMKMKKLDLAQIERA
jgi:predicted 3-demethylubiquinone-9 3-methyltransferase (glyoxalase superfamily)